MKLKGHHPAQRLLCKLTCLLAMSPIAEVAAESRHEDYSRKAAQGPHLALRAATFFGGPDGEEFVGGGTLASGEIVAAGNLTGPKPPPGRVDKVIGSGTHRGLDPFIFKEKAEQHRKAGEFSRDNPDLGGFFVIYDSSLSEIKRFVRFDWGVAALSTCLVTPDGGTILVAGRAGPAFRKLPGVRTHPCGSEIWKYGDAEQAADVFIAAIHPKDGSIRWAHVIEGAGNPPRRLWLDDSGHIYIPAGGLHLVSPNGATLRRIHTRADGKVDRWVGIHPSHGKIYFGGDRNTRTNREPYRQPFLIESDLNGKDTARYWEPNPKEIGSDGGSLESDSSVRGVAFRPDGTAAVIGWSDGGNSVFTRQVGDWREKGVTPAPLGYATWGMKGANSLGHVMLVDFPAKRTLTHAWFAAFLPGNFVDARARNAPNHTSFEDLELMPGGALAVWGRAASGLVQTPNAFRKDPGDGAKYGGTFLTVFDGTLSRLMFSSYLPGLGNPALVAHPRGLLVFSRSRNDDGEPTPTSPPITADSAQTKFGGVSDGHLMLMDGSEIVPITTQSK